MHPRPRLPVGRRPLRRSADSVQLGLAAGEALVLSGLGRGEAALVESLDGRHTLAELYAVAARLRVGRDRVDSLLGLLHSEGLLAPPDPDRLALWQAEQVEPTSPTGAPAAPEPCRVRRRPGYVVVGGWGPVPRAIASTLRAAGVGRVETGPWALDHAELDLRGESDRPPAPELVVLAAQDVLDPRIAQPWRRHGVAQLPVVADSRTIVVGPLVRSDPAGPCLRCVEMHRTDRDERWPDVLAQACPDGTTHRQVRSDPTLTTTAAGIAAMVAVGHLEGRPIPPGLTLELRLPLPRLDHRIWPRHPQCGDHRPYSDPRAG
ncbi:MAG: hypothetical protein WCG47_18960 [Dermatophilaceae bacterium]